MAWIPPEQNAVADFMTDFCLSLFCNDMDDDIDHSNPQEEEEEPQIIMDYMAEPVQVVKYTTGGKYDLHHDGLQRVVTVLTYFNGIAGTWFPFARVDDQNDDEEPPTMTLQGAGMTNGKVPGQDGVWIVGEEHGDEASCSKNIVKVAAGDAVVFYNYEYYNETHPMIMNWKSIHAGMPTSCDKWIATNWIQLGEDKN